MSTGCSFALPIFQQPLIDQGVADGGNRNTAADIVCQKQNNLSEQHRIGDAFLSSALFPLKTSRSS